MRIDTYGGYSLIQPLDKATKGLQKTNRDLNKILQKLSTALRINSASDDAAGLGVAEQLTSQIRGFKTAGNNVTDAMSALNIADGTGQQVSEMIQRQRELALQASNDTLTNEQRQNLNVEYQTLTDEINRVSGATQFNSQNVANGTGLASGAAQIQAGANAGETITIPTVNMSANALLITGTSITTAASAQTAISRLDTALNTLNTQRSELGALTNRFESTVNNLSVAEINTQAAESVLRDQDMAQGLAELTRNQLLTEGTIAAFNRFREISANHLYGLLKT
jgi:flagellin